MRRRSTLTVMLVMATVFMFGAPVEGATVSFGSNLSTATFPNNAYPGKYCNDAHTACTWVMNRVYTAPGKSQLTLKAPKDGTLGRIKIVAGVGGSFRLFLARTRKDPLRAKVVRRGPLIEYNGSACDPSCQPEVFYITLTVKQGDVLSFRTNRASFLRCTDGSPDTWYFTPPLVVGDSFQQPDETDGCDILMQAYYK